MEHLGDQTRLHLRFRGHELLTLADAHTRFASGDTVSIQPRDPLYFEAGGARIT